LKGQFGWEDVRDLEAGSRVSVTVMDDTLPGGPHPRLRVWEAPFSTANREGDYRIAWESFERQETPGGEA
jgi:hypothetical protein